MNNPNDNNDDTSYEGFIKTPKQLIITVILGFAIPIIVILLIISFVKSDYLISSGSDAMSDEAIASRLQPVAGFVIVDEDAPKMVLSAEQVYENTCSTCHDSGVAGAPKFGDKDAWAPLIDSGYDTLLDIALHGKGAMPARGGNPNLSDFEVERAMVYMANAGGASFDEPEEPDDTDKADDASADAEATQAAQTAQAETTDEKPDAQTQEVADASATQDSKADEGEVDPAGEKLYKSICFACHDAGLAGAPKFGDKDAWAPLIATGMDAMVEIAIHGKGGMPPRGGSQASDGDIKAAVQYMVNAAQ